MNILKSVFNRGKPTPTALGPYLTSLVGAMRYEVIPISADKNRLRLQELPAGCPVSVTCSPAKGLEDTIAFCDSLIEQGHSGVVMPHIAARMVDGPNHMKRIASWVKTRGIKEVFIVGGDAAESSHYKDALEFMADFIAADSGVQTVMFTAYPDGHPQICNMVLHETLRSKQRLLAGAGISGVACTQLCFNASTITKWLKKERESGFNVTVHLGIPGVVDRKKLAATSIRLGVGAALKYVGKNMSTVSHLIAPGGYDPTEVLLGIGDEAAENLDISGVHSCTFNSVAKTVLWQQSILNHTEDEDEKKQ
jgi:methylenetetrahydrofolate reductase (NADPH)